MKVIDIFCGAGGLSEGFRQAGFEIIWAIDKWLPAVISHEVNHPKSQTIMGDVEAISLLPDDEFERVVPDSEIIIGSPPCVAFSNSNRSGKGDKTEGIRLIKAYLRIVARKKWKKTSILKYWILENVPNSERFIQDKCTAEDLGLAGDQILQVKNTSSGIYNAAHFGVPSRRKRYFCGEFPTPEKTISDEANIILLKEVMDSLGKPNEKIRKKIKDPNYDFELDGQEVSDHHYVQKLARYQWKTAKRLKQDKGYMGRMAFPENVEKSSRTIMATMTFSARESMVFGNGRGSYRAPTIREIASLMSFPIDYRFYGESIGLKYKLVGNAVPPKIAYAFAKAIALVEKKKPRKKYKPIKHNDNGNFFNLNGKKIPVPQEKPKHPKSRYKYHIPYLIVDTYRVELTNYHSDFDNLEFRWDVEIHRSQGPRAKIYTPTPNKSWLSPDLRQKIEEFIEGLNGQIVDFNEFQAIHCQTGMQRTKDNLIGPSELLEKTRELIDKQKLEKLGDASITIEEEPYSLPTSVALGYYLVHKVVMKMGGTYGQAAKNTET